MTTTTPTCTPAEFVAFIGRATASLTDVTVARLRKAYQAWQGGSIGDGQLADVVAATLMKANAAARSSGDVAGALGLAQLGAHPDPLPLGRAPGVDVATELARLTAAADTLLAGIDDPQVDLGMQLDRIGRAEPSQAMREQVRATYAGNGVDRWYRGLNATACELCQSWAGDGTFPTTVEMLHHPGCGCVPIPTTQEDS